MKLFLLRFIIILIIFMIIITMANVTAQVRWKLECTTCILFIFEFLDLKHHRGRLFVPLSAHQNVILWYEIGCYSLM